MKTYLAVDSAGRVVLPKPLRRQFHLETGAELELSVGPDAITLKPRAHVPALSEVGGLLVHAGVPRGDLAASVDHARRRRDASVAGLFG